MTRAPISHASSWDGQPRVGEQHDRAQDVAGISRFEKNGKAKRDAGKRKYLAPRLLRQQAGIECQEDAERPNCVTAKGLAWSHHGPLTPSPGVPNTANIKEQIKITLAPGELAGGLSADHGESGIKTARAGLEAAIRELLAPKADATMRPTPVSMPSEMVSADRPPRAPPGLERAELPKIESEVLKVPCAPRVSMALPMYANANTTPNYHARPAEAIAELMSLRTLLADRLSQTDQRGK
mmetsp:Transcript_25878/g.74173  ORF Transcript_25878/g.74173 Transcript_25878/m.74173 type:complete len:239 (+) Transcript_25878:58-774(+)